MTRLAPAAWSDSQDEYDFAVTGNVYFGREASAGEAMTC